ncbi:uncharacterized protein SPSK_02885 [Sporothrix schenckii 1099-18]|uniref:Uncharacterized protein n=1 Tax=Sporothrix schenckii 1099-18 TaxID=1397361 RepID=A0A0F2MA57_SPOSC|nr:uncharacterized protein SPSK_02885 [Sporothrix schenckii 1099-18]KJR86578.1 hypothetical protein SPSK_02885 [Sporothrix schenckii 1099-18]
MEQNSGGHLCGKRTIQNGIEKKQNPLQNWANPETIDEEKKDAGRMGRKGGDADGRWGGGVDEQLVMSEKTRNEKLL